MGITAGASSSGTIDVGGPGAAAAFDFAAASGLVAAAGGLTIGQASRGTLNVSDNGTINLNGTDYLTVGSNVGAVGTVVVDGTTASAVINLGTDNVTDGYMGTGYVTISSLGTLDMTSGGGIEMGANAGSSGSLLVNGGTVIEGATSFGINVGGSGNGTATVNNGGSILMDGTGALHRFEYRWGRHNDGRRRIGDLQRRDQLRDWGRELRVRHTDGVRQRHRRHQRQRGRRRVSRDRQQPGIEWLRRGRRHRRRRGGQPWRRRSGVGNDGTGALTVNKLGTIAITGTAGITVGYTTGAVGVMTVNDGLVTEGGSTYGINLANYAGAMASLLIENGGTVALAGGGINAALFASGATGTFTVTGANALLETTGNGGVDVGGPGNATLTVSNGGSLAMLGTGGINVDFTDGSSSQMTVADASVSFVATGWFFRRRPEWGRHR